MENTLSPQFVHQGYEATNHLKDIRDENFQDAINTPIVVQSELETQSIIERYIVSLSYGNNMVYSLDKLKTSKIEERNVKEKIKTKGVKEYVTLKMFKRAA